MVPLVKVRDIVGWERLVVERKEAKTDRKFSR